MTKCKECGQEKPKEEWELLTLEGNWVKMDSPPEGKLTGYIDGCEFNLVFIEKNSTPQKSIWRIPK